MPLVDPSYWGREQTLVKHKMLKGYLGPAARIIGSWCDSFVYVDCCSGPWKNVNEDLTDTSFAIAVQELREARAFLRDRNRNVNFRCLFVEQDPAAFAELSRFCESVTDMEAVPLFGDFTEKIPEIRRFVAQRRNAFPFYFIDPTGWVPLAIDAIAPLLKTQPSEVLINFMTSHIKRFVESSNFETRFGPEYMRKVVGTSGQELDDVAAYAFADEIRKYFKYTCTSVVLNPIKRQTHFHLIYGTRHPTGMEKFKSAEKSCFGLMQGARLEAHNRHYEIDDRQEALFEFAPETDRYMQQLRSHYCTQAKTALQHKILSNAVNETEAWEFASRFPLVWRTDVREWLRAKTPLTNPELRRPTLPDA